jgi:hypothetical protein
MRIHSAAIISLIYGFSIGIGLLQQAIFAFYFGLGKEAGIFFVAITLPSISSLLFNESIQVSLLPDILKVRGLEKKADMLRPYVGRSIAVGVMAFGLSVAWWAIAGHADWDIFLPLTGLLCGAFTLAMIASCLLVWLQADGKLIRPALVHLFPGLAVCATTIATGKVQLVAASYALAAACQICYLWLQVEGRHTIRVFGGGGKSVRPYGTWIGLAPFLVGAGVPVFQMIDRLGRSAQDLKSAAAGAYIWALVMGLAAVMNRGPTLVFSVWVVSVVRRSIARLLILPIVLYGIGSLLAFTLLALITFGGSLIRSRWPAQFDTISMMQSDAGALVLLLGPLACLPALYRLVVQLGGLPLAAGAVAIQIGLQLLLSLAFGLFCHQFNVAAIIAGHVTCVALVALCVYLHGCNEVEMFRKQ